MSKMIEKKKIKGLLKEAVKQWHTYVPQKHIGGDVLIAPLPEEAKELEAALDNISLADDDLVISPKDIFFPQLETMFKFKKGEIAETVESSPKLLFGIKSCDLKGILFADEFFKRDFEDAYYLSRANERLIVVIGCINPPRPGACFCTSAKTGPFAEKGFDLQLVDNGESYFVETGSEKGEEFVAKYSGFFQDESGDAEKAVNSIKAKAEKAVELKIEFQKALDLMANDDFIPEEKYKRIGERCVYCGACVYTCPTCTCFNVFDNAKGDEGTRVRIWDACIFEGYTREASGHNPRNKKWLMTSRRYEHKLKYDKAKTNMSGCVGCGRCLASCPVDIGMSKFVQEITEDKKIM